MKYCVRRCRHLDHVLDNGMERKGARMKEQCAEVRTRCHVPCSMTERADAKRPSGLFIG